MKKQVLCLLLLTPLFSCNSERTETQTDAGINPANAIMREVGTKDTIADEATATDKVRAKYYTTKDTLAIVTATGDTLPYTKNDFNEIVDQFPELYSDYVSGPDEAYALLTPRMAAGSDGQETRRSFGGEAGQDEFYVLYAYFLKMKNGDQKHAARRRKLAELYSNINGLFATFEHGGTYFGHQHLRISGYAEYSVYLYTRGERFISKTYDITKQKDLYIRSLRQLIDDESKIDRETTGADKIQRNKDLNQTVDAIDKAITDNYYLRRVQEFHYRHYEYY